MPMILERARRDIAEGNLWLARRRLEGFVGSRGYDRDVLELLGEVCWQMQDIPAAGRFWFFCVTNSEPKRVAIETLVRDAKGDRRVIASRLPRKLRAAPSRWLPAEVQERLKTIGIECGGTRVRIDRSERPVGRNMAKEYLVFSGLVLIGLFCVYCFSLGLAQILAN